MVNSQMRVDRNVPSKLRTTFRLARTEFLYWCMLGIGLECYCSQSRPMRAQRNKIRGNIGGPCGEIRR